MNLHDDDDDDARININTLLNSVSKDYYQSLTLSDNSGKRASDMGVKW